MSVSIVDSVGYRAVILYECRVCQWLHLWASMYQSDDL